MHITITLLHLVVDLLPPSLGLGQCFLTPVGDDDDLCDEHASTNGQEAPVEYNCFPSEGIASHPLITPTFTTTSHHTPLTTPLRNTPSHHPLS